MQFLETLGKLERLNKRVRDQTLITAASDLQLYNLSYSI